MKRLFGFRSDDEFGSDDHIFEKWLGGKLRHHELNIVPIRQLRAGNPHGSHLTVVAEFT